MPGGVKQLSCRTILAILALILSILVKSKIASNLGHLAPLACRPSLPFRPRQTKVAGNLGPPARGASGARLLWQTCSSHCSKFPEHSSCSSSRRRSLSRRSSRSSSISRTRVRIGITCPARFDPIDTDLADPIPGDLVRPTDSGIEPSTLGCARRGLTVSPT